MKLSVQKKLGFLHVRGGRLLRVAHDHAVPTKGYNHDIDKVKGEPERDPAALRAREGMAPFKPRTFDNFWVTAKIGSIAIEIIACKTNKVMGHAYLTGDAINMIRYSDADSAPAPAHWFGHATGVRVDINPPSMDYPTEKYVAAMMMLKYATLADIASTALELDSIEQAMAAAHGIAQSYSYSAHPYEEGGPAPPIARTHVMAVLTVKGKSKWRATLHLQPPQDVSEYAAQPFFHELVQSSTELVDLDFFGLVPKDLVVESPPTKEEKN